MACQSSLFTHSSLLANSSSLSENCFPEDYLNDSLRLPTITLKDLNTFFGRAVSLYRAISCLGNTMGVRYFVDELLAQEMKVNLQYLSATEMKELVEMLSFSAKQENIYQLKKLAEKSKMGKIKATALLALWELLADSEKSTYLTTFCRKGLEICGDINAFLLSLAVILEATPEVDESVFQNILRRIADNPDGDRNTQIRNFLLDANQRKKFLGKSLIERLLHEGEKIADPQIRKNNEQLLAINSCFEPNSSPQKIDLDDYLLMGVHSDFMTSYFELFPYSELTEAELLFLVKTKSPQKNSYNAGLVDYLLLNPDKGKQILTTALKDDFQLEADTLLVKLVAKFPDPKIPLEIMNNCRERKTMTQYPLSEEREIIYQVASSLLYLRSGQEKIAAELITKAMKNCAQERKVLYSPTIGYFLSQHPNGLSQMTTLINDFNQKSSYSKSNNFFIWNLVQDSFPELQVQLVESMIQREADFLLEKALNTPDKTFQQIYQKLLYPTINNHGSYKLVLNTLLQVCKDDAPAKLSPLQKKLLTEWINLGITKFPGSFSGAAETHYLLNFVGDIETARKLRDNFPSEKINRTFVRNRIVLQNRLNKEKRQHQTRISSAEEK